MLSAILREDNDVIPTTGYLHRDYAASLSDIGSVYQLPKCGGWALQRPIPGFSVDDAMGCYPIFCCQQWEGLETDLDAASKDLVCLSAVTDPFGDYSVDLLQTAFRDVVRPFKEHYIVDLSQSPATFVARHHQRNAHKALHTVAVEQCTEPLKYLDDWVAMYEQLIARHSIHGIAAFSRDTFARQFRVPGLIVYRAIFDEIPVGMVLWYIQHDVGYYHLGAYTEQGYQLGVSFAIFWRAIEDFAQAGLRFLSLGAGAGVNNQGTDGLSRFKGGWSTHTKTAFFCGRVFDPERYWHIVRTKHMEHTHYFPAYRYGEFR